MIHINRRRIKHNQLALAAPTINDDITKGYGVTSTWVYNGLVYVCIDNTRGGADWDELCVAAVTDRVVFVSPTFIDNENTHRFSTIQEAINFAYSKWGVLEFLDHVMIIVYPGTYEEQIHSYRRYNLIAHIESTTPHEKNVTLYNTGADAAHYPLRSNPNDVYDLAGFNVVTDEGGVVGNITNKSEYAKCMFGPGIFLDPVVDAHIYVRFDGCRTFNDKMFNFTAGNKTGTRQISLYNCLIGNGYTVTLESEHTGNSTIAIYDNTTLSYSPLSLKGDWRLIGDKITSYGTSRHVVDTSAKIQIENSIISNGIHFLSAPEAFHYVGNSCIDYAGLPIPEGEGDITADVDIVCDSYVNNVQHNGLDGEILIPEVVKNVGGNGANKYKNLVEAMKSVRGVESLVLFDNLTDIAELVMPVSGEVTIDGQKAYSLTFTADIVELGTNDILKFYRINKIIGGTVEINGDNAEFHMHVCQDQDSIMQILATAGVGSMVHMISTNLLGSAGNSVLQINNVDTEYYFDKCKLVGAIGQPAVEFTLEVNDKLRAKLTTFLHGDSGANAPLICTNGDSNISLYVCGMNANFSAAQFTNTIGNAGNVVDPQINF